MSKLIVLNDGSSSYHGDELDGISSKCTNCKGRFSAANCEEWKFCPLCGSKIDEVVDVCKLRDENASYLKDRKIFTAKYELRYRTELSKWMFYGSFEDATSAAQHIKYLKYVTENYEIQLVSITDGKVVWSWSRRKNEQENR